MARALLDELRPGGVRHRLPDARQRQRGGGRRAGGAPAPAPRARGGRADRVAARVPGHGGRPGWRSTSCARPACGARPTSASGCPSRSSPAATDDPARHAEMADSLSLAFLVLLESLSPEQRAVFLLRDVFDYAYGEIAGDRRQERGQRAPARRRGRAATSTSGGRASRRRASSASELAERFFAAAAGRRPRRRSRRCWPRTSSCTATAAARCPRWRGRCAAASGWRGRWSAWARAGARLGGVECARSRSTASRARCVLDADGRRHRVMALDDRRRRRSRRSARSSTRTSSATSARWPTTPR